MKIKIVILVTLITSFLNAQDNLLDTSSWTVGIGSVEGYVAQGSNDENIRENSAGPHGENVILWKASPDGVSGGSDGGWKTTHVTISHNKKYRVSLWLKKTNSNDGTTYFGGVSNSTDYSEYTTTYLNGTDSGGNAWCFSGDLPQLNTWYLLVGYFHSSGDTSLNNEGRIYDSAGNEIATLNDFKFKTNAGFLRHRGLLAGDYNSSDEQYMFAPAIYEVNGQEPTIAELLNPDTPTDPPSGGETVWNIDGSDINYTDGNVGIGTSSPDMKLTVKGSIHAEEVKVDLSVPAPDYVFKKNYNLKSLEELQDYIQENGHLPNIPSAKEMEANGVEVGKMEMKLLEKIEELTLYVIELKKEIEVLKKN